MAGVESGKTGSRLFVVTDGVLALGGKTQVEECKLRRVGTSLDLEIRLVMLIFLSISSRHVSVFSKHFHQQLQIPGSCRLPA